MTSSTNSTNCASTVARKLAFKVVDRLFIVVYGPEPPTDEEWAAYLADVERHGVERTAQLIYTDGAAPTGSQRRDLEKLLRGRSVPVAVMTNSIRVRWVVSVMSWFNRRICAFPLIDLSDALAYLEIPRSRVELIQREVIRMRASLGLPGAAGGADGIKPRISG